ncbi:MAG: aminodeoxychorismate synthase, component I [Armatimonadetes bacterium]|nr:aminodeoxychorismate synthase, component I [Armatimonadota bacterium]
MREVAWPPSPTAAFAAIAERSSPLLLESGTREPKLGRWSFLACDPFLTYRSKGSRVEIARGERTEVVAGDPFAALRDLLADVRVPRPAGAPPLLAGAMGYFAYDLGRFVETVPATAVDDVPVADCHLGFYGAVLALDHVESRAFISAIGAPETDPAAAQRLAERRVSDLTDLLSHVQADPPLVAPRGTANTLAVSSNFTHAEYLRALRRVKGYIAAGDIYQANLTQRLTAPLASSPWELYRRLTQTNAAPFAGFFETPDCAVVSCSPERFLQVRGGEVETRPIKGTRPRGATPLEDERLAQELLASVKDRAENVMIVDLERNDLGRVCDYGSVHVPELFVLESYATVHHLVSTVRGRLHTGKTALDCLRVSFPGGSITGAPKVRSMEIIEELEPTRRGIYTGAIGYLCFSGDMDVNIVIRTLVIKDGLAHFQVGGGIVADSDPESEYQETLDKARALAAGLAAEAGTEKITWPE